MRMTDDTPNVLLVHCHDLGRHLGCYGRDVHTPNIDDLAEDGALFEHHFATAPQCSPSRGSLFTGQHPQDHGLMGLAHGEWDLHDGAPLLPELLGEAGYETHLFGLQHVTEDAHSVGFDHIHTDGELTSDVSPEVHERDRAQHVADLVEEFLDQHAAETPFFASVGFFELHRVDLGGRFGFDDGRYDSSDPADVAIPPSLPDRPGVRADLAELEGMLAAVDEAVGRITDGLAAAGLDDDTFLLFTTDHGLAFPRAKGCCLDAGIEAALIARYPGVFDGGTRYDELLSNVDILPTILDLIGRDVPDAVHGRSFLPLATDRAYRPREHVFAQMTWHERYNPMRTIRTRDHKYIRNFWHLPAIHMTNDVFVSRAGREVREEYHASPRATEELYDLAEDPCEEENRADEAAYEDIKTTLDDRLLAWMRRTDDPLLDGPVPPADYETIMPWTPDEPDR